MSRTVDLWTPGVTTRNTPGGFLLNPNTIRAAVNTGRQAAEVARNAYTTVSNLLRSPRIAAGSIRPVYRRMPNPRYRGRRNWRRRGRFGRRRTYRRFSRRIRRPKTSLARSIKRRNLGLSRLISRAKNPENIKLQYDVVHLGEITGSYTSSVMKVFNAKPSDFPKIVYFCTTSASTANVTSFFREFKILACWIKAVPKRAMNIRNATTFPEVVDQAPPFLQMWPMAHNRNEDLTTYTALTNYRLKTSTDLKRVSFAKSTGTIMRHAPYYEDVISVASNGVTKNMYQRKRLPWMEYDDVTNPIAFGCFAAQLPQFYTSTPATETRELPKYTFEMHIVFALRNLANSPDEIAP